VHPEQIESELARLAGVRSCHVAGYRRGDFDELAALVEPDGSATAGGAAWRRGLADALRTVLSPAQLPARFVEVETAPVGATGKWDRLAVIELLAAADC
jgi:hypothetical protein